MKRFSYAFILAALLSVAFALKPQKTVNQRGIVREISYDNKQKAVPIGNVRVELVDGVIKISDANTGTFTLPVLAKGKFSIKSIVPPRESKYSFVSPLMSDLGTKGYMPSSNIFEIILANESKIEAERERIILNRNRSFNRYISDLNNEIEDLKLRLQLAANKSEAEINALRHRLDSVQAIYNEMPRQLDLSLMSQEARRLALVDCAGMTDGQLEELELRKSGDWQSLINITRSRGLASDAEMDSIASGYAVKERNVEISRKNYITSMQDAAASMAQLTRNFDSFRNMFEGFSNQHLNDSALFYLEKIVRHGKIAPVEDFLTAADFASRRLNDHAKAVQYAGKAVEFSRGKDDPQLMIRSLISQSEVVLASGNVMEAGKSLAAADSVAAAHGLGDTPAGWELSYKQGMFEAHRGNLAIALGRMEACYADLDEKCEDELTRLRFLGSFAKILSDSGDRRSAETLLNSLAQTIGMSNSNLAKREIYGDVLLALADIASSRGDLDGSEKMVRDAVKVYDDVFRHVSISHLQPYSRLASIDFSRGKYDEALRQLDENVRMTSDLYAHPEIPLALLKETRATWYVTLGREREAEELYKEAIPVLSESLDNYPVNSYSGLAELMFGHGDYAGALEMLETCDSVSAEKFGDNSPVRADILFDKASVLKGLQRFAEARRDIALSISILEGSVGKEAPRLILQYLFMTQFELEMGNIESAKNTLAMAERLDAKIPDEFKPTGSLVDNVRISFLLNQGLFSEAREIIDRNLKASSSKLGESHPTAIHDLEKLADWQETMGQYDEAFSTLQKCARLTTEHYGHNDFLIAKYIQRFSKMANYIGDLQGTIEYARRYMEICDSVWDSDNINTMMARLELLNLNFEKFSFSEQEEMYNRIIEAFDNKGESNNFLKFKLIKERANLLASAGFHDRALQQYQIVQDWAVRNFGKIHPNYFAVKSSMATALQNLGDYKAACAAASETLDCATGFYGKDHPRLFDLRLSAAMQSSGVVTPRETLSAINELIKDTEFSKMSPLTELNAYTSLSSLYASLEDWKPATEYFEKAWNLHFDIYRQENINTISVYLLRAKLDDGKAEIREALQWYDKAFSLAEKFYQPDNELLMNIDMRRIHILLALQKLDEARRIADKWEGRIASGDGYDSYRKNYNVCRMLSNLYLNLGNVDKSMEMAVKMAGYVPEGEEMRHMRLDANYQLANAEAANMNYDRSLELLSRAESLAIELDNSFMTRDVKLAKASIYGRMSRHADAVGILESVREQVESIYGSGNAALISIDENLWTNYVAMMEFKKSMACFDRLENLYVSAYGEDSPKLAMWKLTKLTDSSLPVAPQQRLEEMEKCCGVISSTYGEDSYNALSARTEINFVRFTEFADSVAENELRGAVNELARRFGEDSPQVAQHKFKMAQAYLNSSKVDRARPLLDDALAISNGNKAVATPVFDSMRLSSVNAFILAGDYAAADSLLSSTRKSFEERFGRGSLKCFPVLMSELDVRMTRFSREPGELDRLKKLIEEAEMMTLTHFGEKSVQYANICNIWGNYYIGTGLNSSAEDAYGRYRDILSEIYGEDSPNLFGYYAAGVKTLLQEAASKASPFALPKAEKYAEKCVRIAEEKFGSVHTASANAYALKSMVFFAKVQKGERDLLEDALKLNDTALSIIEKNGAGSSVTALNMLNTKMQMQSAVPDLPGAYDTLERMMEITRKFHGSDSYETNWMKCTKAQLEFSMGNYDEAELIYSEVIRYLADAMPGSFEFYNVSSMHAATLFHLGRIDEASEKASGIRDVLETLEVDEQYSLAKSSLILSLNNLLIEIGKIKSAVRQ